MKKTICLILCAVTLLSLCACGQSGEYHAAASAPASKTPAAAAESPAARETVLAPAAAAMPLPDGMAYAVAQCRIEDGVWVGGLCDDGSAALGRVGLSDGETRLLELEETDFIYAMCASPDGLAVLCGSKPAYYIAPDGSTLQNDGARGRLELLRLDVYGTVISRTELAGDYSADGIIFYIAENGGSYIMQAQNSLIKIAADGTETARTELPSDGDELSYFAGIALCEDGLLAAVGSFGDLPGKLYLYDPDTLTSVSEFAPDTSLNGIKATESGLSLCTEAGISLLDALDGDPEPALEWKSLYLESDWNTAEEYGDGYLLFSRYEREITYTCMTEQLPRTHLSLATDYAYGCVQTLVTEFNRSQDKYIIDVRVYGESGDSGTLDRLRTEIGAGSAPDIFAFCLADTLGDIDGEGLYADLLPLLDGDGDYGRDSFVPTLLDSMEDGGRLWFLPYKFTVATMTARQSLLPQAGATLDEMNAALERLGGDYTLLQNWVSSHQLLSWSKNFAVGKYVDFDANSCSFDSDGFIDLLKMCAQCPYEDQFSGEVFTGVLNYDYLLMYDLLQGLGPLSALSVGDYWHGDFCFAGFPSYDGCGSYFQLQARLAVSASCGDTDGAWEFLRFTMSDAAQHADEYAFPSSQSALEAQINDAVDGERLTEADAEKFWALLDSTSFVETSNRMITTIIENEAEVFFAGDCTAEEAASRIQSKVGIYLSERS